MSCRHYCIDSHKYILETFLSIKNFIKHFAGIFTRIWFDKYWRLFFKNELFFNELFSVIYKKNLLIWRFCL